MAVRITEACSTLIIAAVAPSAALLVAIVDQLARVTIFNFYQVGLSPIPRPNLSLIRRNPLSDSGFPNVDK